MVLGWLELNWYPFTGEFGQILEVLPSLQGVDARGRVGKSSGCAGHRL